MIAEEIITNFETQVDDMTELSSVEELTLLNKIYKKICVDRPWEFLKRGFSQLMETFTETVTTPQSLGPELVVNGEFLSDDSGWDVGADWSHGSSAENFSFSSGGGILPSQVNINSLNRGTGYSVDDILTLDGGDGNAQVIVTELDMSGAIQTLAFYAQGTGYDGGTFTYSLLGGLGTGAEADIGILGATLLSQEVPTIAGQAYIGNIFLDSDDSNITGVSVFMGATFATATLISTLVSDGGVELSFAAVSDNETMFIVPIMEGVNSGSGSVSFISLKQIIPEYNTTTITGYGVTLPDNFSYLSYNNNYTEDNQDAKQPCIFVGSDASGWQTYKVVSFSDRRQYRNKTGYAYVDIANDQLVFPGTPNPSNTVEFDYIYEPDDLALEDEPVFPARFHWAIIHGMAVDDSIIQQSDKAKTYAPENQGKYAGVLSDMYFWNARLIIQ